MTIGDRPGELAVGYLLNQNMLRLDDRLTGIEHDDELEVVVVRTQRATDYEAKLRKKIRTSGCAVGTVFGALMEKIDGVVLTETEVRTSWLSALSTRINTIPNPDLETSPIHGRLLC